VVIKVDDSQGNIATQAFTIEVSANPRNQAPVITSRPRTSATAEGTYEYQVTARDPEGEALRFELIAGPNGMQIGETTGLLSWNPVASDPDTHIVSVAVFDPSNARALQTYVLEVRANEPPAITSDPVTTAIAGIPYGYDVRAVDPNGDTLTYTLTTAPTDMAIDQLGRITWHPAPDFPSNDPVPVTVTVRDPLGLEASQSYEITVRPDSEAPRVSLSVSTNLANPGDTVRFLVTATDNVGVVSLALTVGGQALALDATGRASLVVNQPGVFEVIATARDAAGNVGTSAPFNLRVFDTSDTAWPVVQIISPDPTRTNNSVTYLTDVIGSVSDDNLEFWRLHYARVDQVNLDQIVNLANPDNDDPDWRFIAQGTTNVASAKLGTFDPTMLQNGPYVIRLMARDVNGRISAQGAIVNVEGAAKIGNFHLEFTDLQVPLAGIPITITRVYDTLQANDEGDFGFGWTLGLRDARILETVPAGEDFVPAQTKVYLTGPDGRRIGFTYQEQFAGGFPGFGAVYNPYFTPDKGVTDTLSVEGQVGRGGVIDALREPINFDIYILTTQDGTKYRYSQRDGLLRIDERNGANVRFTDAGIFHSSGVSITFDRDHRNRITKITQRDFQGSPVGEPIRYQYDAAGDLRFVALQGGLTTQFKYLAAPNAHFLDEAIDPNGNRSLKVIYENNRFVRIEDAQGNTIDQRDYDLEARTAIIRDGNGNETTLVYNDRGNVLTETDAFGNTKEYEYTDPTNPDLETKIIDVRGLVTERTYDARGNVTEIRETGPQDAPFADPIVTAFTYDTRGNVKSITNDANHKTNFNYDALGNLTVIANAQGHAASFTYDSQGRRKTFTDFNGNTTLFEYRSEDCGCSEPRKITFPDGTYQTFDYNHFGQVIEEATFEKDNTLVEIITTKYDALGREVEVIRGRNQDAIITRKFYKGSNLDYEMVVNPVSPDETRSTPVAERKSRITAYDYDANGRMIRQINPDGGVVEFRYDAQGNRILLMDPVGNVTTWVYDKVNRVSEERDPFFWRLFTENIPVGNIDIEAIVAANKLPSGADITERLGADHVRVFGHDAAGNQIAMIDRNGRMRELVYDHAGRMTQERWYEGTTQTVVRTMVWRYDTLGNLVEAFDPDSHYVYTYDTLNRVKSVDNNPLGDLDLPRVILSYVYDRQGNVISTSDNFGVTVASEYDARNRLKVRKWFDAIVNAGETPDVDPVRVDFAYNAAGRQSVLDRRASLDLAAPIVARTTTSHRNNGLTDVLRHANAVDEVLASYDYGYDFGGLVITEDRDHQDPAFRQTIEYGYDLNGQLIKADYDTQPDEEFVYDLNGNRKLWQNGDETITYGAPGLANQLTSDSQFTYEYDGEGNLIKKTETATGQATTHEYDHHNRLIRVAEWSRDPGDPTNPSNGAVLTHRADFVHDVMERHTVTRSSTRVDVITWSGLHEWSVAETDGQARRLILFAPGMDRIVAEHQAGQLTWRLSDSLGTIRDVYAPAEAGLTHVEQSAFGVPRINTSHLATLQGRPLDTHVTLYHFRSRSYDPTSGLFTSQDRLGFGGGDSNLYRFVQNSPGNGRDPLGTVTLVEHSGRLGTLTGSTGAPTHYDVVGAGIGFFTGFGVTNLLFVGYFLEFNPGNAAGFLDVIQRTNSAVNEILRQLEIPYISLSTRGAGGTLSANGFISSFKTGVSITISLDFDPFSLVGTVNGWIEGENILEGVVQLSGLVDGRSLTLLEDPIGGFRNGASLALRWLSNLFDIDLGA
jgi:RHS repeat-associated protein